MEDRISNIFLCPSLGSNFSNNALINIEIIWGSNSPDLGEGAKQRQSGFEVFGGVISM